jgi:alkylhydroperoxidase/carboxymuconolactone decarboxylase family protein YurZ
VRWLYCYSRTRRPETGATAEEIAEALGVAITVNAGAALVFSARVMDAVTAGAGSAKAPV